MTPSRCRAAARPAPIHIPQGDRAAPAIPPPRLLVALLAGLLTVAGCFEDPVEESVHLELRRGGAVEITARTLLPAIHLDSANPRLARRLRQQQQAMAEGWDGWPARFAAAAPADEVVLAHRRGGQLVETARRGLFHEPVAVERFFADRVNSTYTWDAEAGVGELIFYPTVGGPALGSEVQELERRLEPWSRAGAAYLEAVAELYAHLDEHPEDQDPALRQLFADLLPEKNRRRARRQVSDEGQPRVARVDETMTSLLALLVVPEDGSYTLNELSRRVYDPFPGHVTLAVPSGEILEVEGFVPADDGWQIPRLDLWTAFAALEGRWVSPDPAAAYLDASLAGGEIDLSPWRTGDLRAESPPTPAELLDAVEEGLHPKPVYRLLWSLRRG